MEAEGAVVFAIVCVFVMSVACALAFGMLGAR